MRARGGEMFNSAWWGVFVVVCGWLAGGLLARMSIGYSITGHMWGWEARLIPGYEILGENYGGEYGIIVPGDRQTGER